MKTKPEYMFKWRGIDWRSVERIDGAPGRAVDVIMRNGTRTTLDHYPGEGTFQRASHYLTFARTFGGA